MKLKETIKHIKILRVDEDGLVAAKGYSLFYRKNGNAKWERYARIKDGINSWLAVFPLSRRLTRAEITKCYRFEDGSELCIARKGIFRREANARELKKVFNVVRGSRPMNICEDKDGSLYFGEYFQNMDKQAVHIYQSRDGGRTWGVVYTFAEGNINHVHGIFLDPYTQRMWFVTGDRENECIIGYTEDGFKTVKEVFRGGQEFRSCVLFFYKDFIVFGTDSQYQSNVLKRFYRDTLEIVEMQAVQGPVIRGTQMGDVAMISTDVEPSEVNKTKKTFVWITQDGKNWHVLCEAEKDLLHPTLFQFGVFDLPQYQPEYHGKDVYVTGKAVKKYGGNTLVFEMNK